MKKLVFVALLCGAMSGEAAVDWDPFYEHLEAANGANFSAWRPFYSTSVNGERWRKDYLWPLYTRKGFKEETYGRLLFFGYSLDYSPDTEREHTWLIPFYFQGTSTDGEHYLAVFPLGGTMREFLGRDRLWFVLFPLYAQSSIDDVHTTSVLWPIYSRTVGDRIDRFRVWPLYGRSTLENEFEKKFILWPVYTSVHYTNDRNPGGGFILFPLYGRIVTERAVNQWLLPPFFRYAHGEDERVIYAPWPFIQWSDGQVYKRYVWPLYGTKEAGTESRQFLCWPVVWNSRVKYVDHEQHRFRILPVFHYETQVMTKSRGNLAVGEVADRYWKVWPLMSWQRNADSSRFRMLELWPTRNNVGLERNWAPLWTLYRRTNEAGQISHRLLWGLYDQERGDGEFEWSLLKGLVGYKNMDNNRSFRLLFIRFGGKEDQP